MIEKLSWSVTNYFVGQEVILKEEDEIYAFGFECLIADGIQSLVLFIAGLLCGNLIPLALTSLTFVVIRRNIGGYHANSHFTCILFTSLSFVFGTLICGLLPIWSCLVFLPAANATIWLLAPVTHPNNPKTEDEIKILRKLSLRDTAIVTVLALALFISPLKAWTVYIASGLLLAAISLLIPSDIF